MKLNDGSKLSHNGSGIYAGRELMLVSPMPVPLLNKDKKIN